MYSLGAKIDANVKPVFTSGKLSQTLSVKENKPPIVNIQCVVYCTMQIMSCTLPDTDLHQLNTVIQQLGNTFKHSMATTEQRLTILLKF